MVLYTNIVSPHQLPIAEAYRRLFPDDRFLYVYKDSLPEDATKRGWKWTETREWIVDARHSPEETVVLLQNTKTLLCGIRDVDLFEERERRGLTTLYMAERWFKPFLRFPGWVRMLVPSYYRMAKRFVRWVNRDANARVLAIGPWAKNDFIRMGVLKEKVVDWGYFVAPSTEAETGRRERCSNRPLRVLWVGRMLSWKCVDTIIKAVKELSNVRLTLVGQGEERRRLVELAKDQPISFIEGQPISMIREIMRKHDVYVLSSDAQEGWGVALQEALLEGMIGIGTFEAGASAALLPKNQLYHARDVRALRDLLLSAKRGAIGGTDLSEWTPEAAAIKLHNLERC